MYKALVKDRKIFIQYLLEDLPAIADNFIFRNTFRQQKHYDGNLEETEIITLVKTTPQKAAKTTPQKLRIADTVTKAPDAAIKALDTATKALDTVTLLSRGVYRVLNQSTAKKVANRRKKFLETGTIALIV